VGSRLPAPFERDPMTPVDPRSLDAEASEAPPGDRGDDGIDEIEPID
jgi:hypothetical protein